MSRERCMEDEPLVFLTGEVICGLQCGVEVSTPRRPKEAAKASKAANELLQDVIVSV